MPTHVLATKLYVPAPHPLVVARLRLLQHLNGQLTQGRKLTLACATAESGTTTMLSETAHSRQQNPEVRVAWLLLDDGEKFSYAGGLTHPGRTGPSAGAPATAAAAVIVFAAAFASLIQRAIFGVFNVPIVLNV